MPPRSPRPANSPYGYLEPEYHELYQRWQKERTPQLRAEWLRALDPTIRQITRQYAESDNPIAYSTARRLASEALDRYDPSQAKLSSYLYQHLQGLKRQNRQQTQAIRVPERMHFDRYYLERYTRELEHELGREPTDQELADRTGFSLKRLQQVRQYKPETTVGQVSSRSLEAESGDGRSADNTAVILPHRNSRDAWVELVYQDLDPYHQKIMEYSLGLNGRKPLANQEIAKKLKRSPGAISQAKAKIQKLIDEGDRFSIF